jgi:citrate synthase
MGNKSFLECFFLTMYDKYPTQGQLAELNRYFNDAFRSVKRDDAIFTVIPAVATAPEFSLNGLIAGLSVDRQATIKAIEPPDLGDVKVSDIALSGFYFMAILPIIAGFSASFPVLKDKELLLNRLQEVQAAGGDYVDRIIFFFRGMPVANRVEKRIMEAVLVAFCAGFGFLTPSVMTPRISIGSGVSVGLSFIAACTTAGPWHLGTSQDVIIMFAEMMAQRNGRPVDEYVTDYVTSKLTDGKKLLGFGHPFFKKDPRVIRLLEIMQEEGYTHDVLQLFDSVTRIVAEKKNIYPNLETGHGAIMTSLGITIPFLGPSIALIGRAGGVVAHIEERLTKPAFGVKNEVARNFFDKVPMGWL